MAIVIPYTKQTWVDGNTSNPVSAARMGVLEEGILDVSQAPAVRVTHSAAQSVITSGTAQALIFDTERFDQAAGLASTMHSTVSNTSRLTAIYAGIYQITGQMDFAGNATGVRYCWIRHQGATNIGQGQVVSAAVDNNGRCQVTTLWSFAVNEYAELMAFQTSGGALNVSSCEFMMMRVG